MEMLFCHDHMQYDSLMSKSNSNDATTTTTTETMSSVVPPPYWEFFHNHTILALQLYYDGKQLITDLPQMEPDVVLVPLQKRYNPKEAHEQQQKLHASKKATNKSLKTPPPNAEPTLDARDYSYVDAYASWPVSEIDAKSAYRAEQFSAADSHNEPTKPASREVTMNLMHQNNPKMEEGWQRPKQLRTLIKMMMKKKNWI
jgi:hypothetical protein